MRIGNFRFNSGIGAAVSFAGGYLLTPGMPGTTGYFFSFGSIMYVPAGMFIGIMICLISGVYPAWSASKPDPIEALRAE